MVHNTSAHQIQNKMIELISRTPLTHDSDHVENNLIIEIPGFANVTQGVGLEKGEDQGPKIHGAHHNQPGIELKASGGSYYGQPYQEVVSKRVVGPLLNKNKLEVNKYFMSFTFHVLTDNGFLHL